MTTHIYTPIPEGISITRDDLYELLIALRSKDWKFNSWRFTQYNNNPLPIGLNIRKQRYPTQQVDSDGNSILGLVNEPTWDLTIIVSEYGHIHYDLATVNYLNVTQKSLERHDSLTISDCVRDAEHTIFTDRLEELS